MTDANDFFRFPHTPHLAWLGAGQPRDDKVLSAPEVKAFLAGPVVVEEKMDGANLGVSLDEEGNLVFQNRGQFLDLPYVGQFARLPRWLESESDKLFDALSPQLIAFGEWCAAQHSLEYTLLPNWWLVFDVYDREAGRFWSSTRRNAWAKRYGLSTVPQVASDACDLSQLKAILATHRSRYRSGPMEGIVVRSENGLWLQNRAKLVRADFTQSIGEHWRGRTIRWNRLSSS